MNFHYGKSRIPSCRDRVMRIEPLEPRLALDGEGVLLGTDAQLTLSFAPDGTDVAGQSSSLVAKFNAIATEAEWQEAILRAFQTWAQHTNADIGLVSDSGDPLGSPGSTRRDERFGDIRIAAVSMEPEVGAISVPIDNVLSGTWYADVVFNADFNYQSVDDIFAIALHEAGNVFGLEDNEDPNSPMMSGPIPTATVPTPADIANLQALHGTRAPDIHELEDGPNDTLVAATEVSFGDVGDDVEGSAPALTHGDIQSSSDVDYFALAIPEGYAGNLTVQVRTEGMSMLKHGVSLLDSGGGLLSSGNGTGLGGGRVELQALGVNGGETYFVRVESVVSGVYEVGGFSLVGVLDGLNTVSQTDIDSAADGSLRFLDDDDLGEFFDPNEDFFNDDLGTDDTSITAAALQPSAGFSSGSRSEAIGSISVLGDVDYYSLTSPDLGGQGTMYVAIRTLDNGRLIPSATVLDANQQVLPSRILVNGAGEYLIEVEGVGPEVDLFVRVSAADDSGPFNQGNYAIAVNFTSAAVQLTTFASGTLADTQSQNEHTLHVGEPQLFHFALEVDEPSSVGLAAVIVEILNEQGSEIHQIAAPPGQTRSAGAVFLPIGSYQFRVVLRTLDGTAAGPLSYSVIGAAFSDPFVGDGSDPTTNPFACDDPQLEGFFCYPGDIISSDPFLWEDFVNSLPDPPPELDLTDLVHLLLGDWWSWLWGSIGENGMPLAVDDFFGPPSSLVLNAITSPRSVLSNDFEPENEPMVAILASGPANGNVTLNPDGSFEYTPNTGFVGDDHFTYTAYDFRQESTPATVTIAVTNNTSLEGDYDRDFDVDQQDYQFWRSYFGSTSGVGLQADGNGDGIVDTSDYAVWLVNLGRVAQPLSLVTTQEAPPVVESSPAVQVTQTSSVNSSRDLSALGLDSAVNETHAKPTVIDGSQAISSPTHRSLNLLALASQSPPGFTTANALADTKARETYFATHSFGYLLEDGAEIYGVDSLLFSNVTL